MTTWRLLRADDPAEARIATGGATLVRPDGIVAWRSRGPADHADVEDALATALALDSAREGAAA